MVERRVAPQITALAPSGYRAERATVRASSNAGTPLGVGTWGGYAPGRAFQAFVMSWVSTC
jgi:hypothetical protein